jgi:hypothetical protein
LLPYGMLPVALLMAVMMALSLRLHKPMRKASHKTAPPNQG